MFLNPAGFQFRQCFRFLQPHTAQLITSAISAFPLFPGSGKCNDKALLMKYHEDSDFGFMLAFIF